MGRVSLVSIVNNGKSNYKFQFGRFKKENWDIEHIHSVKSSMPEREEHRRDWMNEVLDYTKVKDLKQRIKQWLDTEKKSRTEEFETIYDDVLKTYSEEGIVEEVDDLTNLTLLDAGTNRGYKNSIYPS